MVYGLCRVLLRDADDAEDAAQQVFLSAHRSLLGGTEPREPVAWLGAIARNECRARIRQRMRTPLALVDERAAAAADVEHVAGQRAEIEALCAALAELPQQQREALVLREFYGLSYDEVRAALGVTDAAVESLLFRARKRLQFELRPARVASGALALPLALRDSLAGAVPGFASPSSGGVLAKLASLPVAAKLAAAAATLTAAGTIGFVEVKSGHREPLTQPSRAPARERARVGGTESDSPLELARAAVAPQPVKGPVRRHERGADDDEQDGAAEDQPAAGEEPEDDEVGAVEPAETEGEQGDADDGDEPANSTAGDDSNEDDGDE